jgi:hypothetical protein
MDYEEEFCQCEDDIDGYIKDLLRRLQLMKDARKDAQNRKKIVEHRLVLLQNQEKLAMRKLEEARKWLNKVINKRGVVDKENQIKEKERKNLLFYEKEKFASRSKEKQNLQKQCFEKERHYQKEFQKKKLKDEILQKILQDEEERKLLEQELANIKKEEIKLVNTINGNKINENVYIHSLDRNNYFFNK